MPVECTKSDIKIWTASCEMPLRTRPHTATLQSWQRLLGIKGGISVLKPMEPVGIPSQDPMVTLKRVRLSRVSEAGARLVFKRFFGTRNNAG